MKHFKNFKQYQPDTNEKKEIAEAIGAIFIKSDEGKDWYEVQTLFSKDSIKVCYDSDGVIRATSNDNSDHCISKMWPINMSVLEVENNAENRKVDSNGGWVVRNGKVQPRVLTLEEQSALADKEKQSRYSEAKLRMEPLIFASEIGALTQEEQQKLTVLKTYMVDLYRLDTSKPDSIIWPEIPN